MFTMYILLILYLLLNKLFYIVNIVNLVNWGLINYNFNIPKFQDFKLTNNYNYIENSKSYQRYGEHPFHCHSFFYGHPGQGACGQETDDEIRKIFVCHLGQVSKAHTVLTGEKTSRRGV